VPLLAKGGLLDKQKDLLLAENGKKKFFYGYVIVIACFVMMVVWWGTFYSFGVFFESLLVEFGWTRAVTAGAYSLHGVLFGLFGIPIARYCDRVSPRLVIGICGLIGGVGYLLMSQLSTVWQLYLLYGLLISFTMGAYIAILPVVAKWFVKRRGLMTGVVFSGMGIGMIVIPPLASQLISAYDWRLSYIIMGVIALVGIVIGAQFLRRDPQQVGLLPYGADKMDLPSPVSESRGFTFKEALRTRQFWLVSALYFIFLVCQLAVTVHIVIHATGIGVPAISAARLLAVFGALLIVGMNTMGMTADKFGNRSAFIISFVIMTISFILVLLINEAWVLFLFVGVLGFACGGMQVLFSPIIAELFGLSSHGVILATAAFIGGIGAAVGPVLAGYVFDTTNSYSLAFIICLVLAAIAIILALLLRPLRREGGRNQ